ncbi:hypothetical protein EU78_28205 [Mycolicibacterium rufum]|nr:hypothetical protein EU78_28205 [Mycolicibacterium rufum]
MRQQFHRLLACSLTGYPEVHQWVHLPECGRLKQRRVGVAGVCRLEQARPFDSSGHVRMRWCGVDPSFQACVDDVDDRATAVCLSIVGSFGEQLVEGVRVIERV